MFDMLTRDELSALHTWLHNQCRDIREHMMFNLNPLSEAWELYAAHRGELSEMMDAVFAEAERRSAERAGQAAGIDA